MDITVKAILARWKGDRTKAIGYCYSIIDTYPSLRVEYRSIIDIITGGQHAV